MTDRDRGSGLDELGPAFAVHTHAAGAPPPAPWQPVSTLLDASGDAWRARTAAVRRALEGMAGRPVEERVAFATAHLGVVARVLAPAFALAVVSSAVPPPDVWWRPVPGGMVPVSFGSPVTPVAPGSLVDAFADSVVPLVAGLTEAAAGTNPVAPAILRDNSASALNSSVTMLAAARPALAGRAARLADALLRRPPWSIAAPDVGAGFRRNSCCLIYRLDPGPPRPVCGDCVLR
ncbi:(2Fe-2S)-binding protein [Cryptosporangium arvum]|uniref:(2Fe-2S)-binding protein n=1 Tax=Cryptosporangium arvum TaxID=80871 RepID=UPI0004B6EF6F|nr:(2Fe-2S)-binding protein [Cryptosporangium arvum]